MEESVLAEQLQTICHLSAAVEPGKETNNIDQARRPSGERQVD